MKLIKIVKSRKKDKKYDAVFVDDDKQKVVSFGSAGAEDYTIGASDEKRKAYRIRHKKDLETDDPTRAGFLAYYILWNKKSLDASIEDYKRRFNL